MGTLLDSIRWGDTKRALHFLRHGVDVHAIDRAGQTALHVATRHMRFSIIDTLLEKGADVTAKDNDGRTVLHIAVSKQCISLISLFIEKGVSTEVADNKGQTPLHYAAQSESVGLVRCLLAEGAKVKAVDNDGRTALSYAAEFGTKYSVLSLLDEGADIMAVDNADRNCLEQRFTVTCETTIRILFHFIITKRRWILAKQAWLSGVVFPISDTAITNASFNVDTQDRGLVSMHVFQQHWNINWGSHFTQLPETRDLGSTMTISTKSPGSHAYIYMTVREYLHEYYPSFGSRLLQWIERIHAWLIVNSPYLHSAQTFAKMEIANLPRRVPEETSPYQSNRMTSANGGWVYLTVQLMTGNLDISMTALEGTMVDEVKSALAWILVALDERHTLTKQEGLFSCPATAQVLDKGLPRAFKRVPDSEDVYCWTNLFDRTSLFVVDLQQSGAVQTKQRQGLEIDIDRLVERTGAKWRCKFEDGTHLLYGHDAVLAPLHPAESNVWYFFRTAGTTYRSKPGIERLRQLCVSKGLTLAKYCNGERGSVYVGGPALAIRPSTPSEGTQTQASSWEKFHQSQS